MSEAVIAYDWEPPEIPDRSAWERPKSYLVKDHDAPTGWRVDDSGRRPSPLLLPPEIRTAVDAWRDTGYAGASEVTRRLFAYWFDEDHEVDGFDTPFRYYFCQREAIETLAWLVEVARQRDVRTLIETHGKIHKKDLIPQKIEFRTGVDGRRQLRRYVPELERDGVQDLPPENLRRFAVKMATGSGKTWVMAMAVVWSRFHRQRVPGSDLSTNFLIVAPNVIVYQRLENDFANNRIFRELPLIPPEWRGGFSQKVILRGDSAEPDPTGNLFLTNVHELYESRDHGWTPANAGEAIVGSKPAQALAASSQRTMLERVKSLADLVVMNDEAHHVHDEDLAWSQSLLAVHAALPAGLAAWLDFSATPKDQNGMYFPWTVVDYPLAQAVEDRIVKAPVIVAKEGDRKQPAEDPDGITKANVAEKYGFWLQAAVRRWKEHRKAYGKLGIRPVLFIMVEKDVHADTLGECLWKTPEFGFEKSEVLVIHIDSTGEVRKGDLDRARQAAGDIDQPGSRIKAIVSVMMLREGWDLRNVTVVLGLRPYTAKAEILPEQVIGRGLRPMQRLSPDRTQTLEVLGTRNLLRILREQLEAEGVGVVSTRTAPPPPVVIEPVRERLDYDIAIPITKPALRYDDRELSRLEGRSLDAVFERRSVEFDRADFRLSETRPFSWRRDLPPLVAAKTVFNYVATYNGFERRFAEFLDHAADVERFAALGTTEQGASGTTFRVDYLKASGAIGFYYPDWVAVQATDGDEVNWIIETKGRVWEGTREKDAAMQDWCRRVSAATATPWRYVRVNQSEFNDGFTSFRELVVQLVGDAMFRERDQRPAALSREEVRRAREEGRA